jgi:hypothetical protein
MALQAIDAMAPGMRLTPLLIAAALAAPLPLLAQAPSPRIEANGPIGTIERGQYVCELPGDAGGSAGLHQPQEDFRIASASRYRAADGDGTYLRRGDIVTMTSGPRNGAQYAVISPSFLRKIENGVAGRLRCFRRER